MPKTLENKADLEAIPQFCEMSCEDNQPEVICRNCGSFLCKLCSEEHECGDCNQ